jgi:beta-glucosidase
MRAHRYRGGHRPGRVARFLIALFAAVAMPAAALTATASAATSSAGRGGHAGYGVTAVHAQSGSCPWVGSSAPVSAKVDEVLAQMTLPEKLAMIHGSTPNAGYAGYVPGIPRLCVPALKLEDNASGVGDGLGNITALPDGEAAAATWNPALMTEYGRVVGQEQRAKGTNVVLGPMINVMRDPRWGRNYETFSEDPYLTSVAGNADIAGIQSQGLIATPKHIGAYQQEFARTQVNSVVSQRALEEIYLAPFESAVQQGGAGAIMAAADYTNGVYDNEDPFQLTQSAKTDWQFPGFVMSDWDGAHSVNAVTAGLDLTMPVAGNYGAPLQAALQNGSVNLAYVNDHVARILTEMFAHGILEHPDTGTPGSPASTPANVAFAKQAAEQSTVLLKNGGHLLPLDASKGQSIAVIGAAGGTAPKAVGCGSGAVSPSHVVSPLAGIENRAGSAGLYSFDDGITQGWQAGANVGSVSAVTGFADGPGSPFDGGYALDAASAPNLPVSAPKTVQVTPASPLDLSKARTFFVHVDGYGGAPGASGYQATVTLSSGSQTLTRTVAVSNDTWNLVSVDVSSWPYRGKVTGISVSYAGTGSTSPWTMHFQIDDVGWATAAVGYADGSNVQAAAQLASTSDVAVVFANDQECEQGGASYDDRTSLDIGGNQDQLISAVAAANPRTIVVLDTGSPVTAPWLDQVPALLEGWYPGQEDGDAIAAVLFGDADPSGRLPQTWPASPSQMPTSSPGAWADPHTDAFSEGIDVGYRWYQVHNVTPLFVFGYGMSYTTFAFGNERVTPVGRPGGTTLHVSATVTNTGTRTGWEVAQLYVGDPATNGEPPKQLEGFLKVQLRPGESTSVSFTLDSSNLRYWDSSAGAWSVAPGTYQLMIGDSSADTPLDASYTVSETTGARTVTVSAPQNIEVGRPDTVTTTLTAGGTETLHGVRMSLDVPAGWSAVPTSRDVFGTVSPGQQEVTTWRVTAPASDSARLAEVSGRASFATGWGTQTLSGSRQVLVPEIVTGQFSPGTMLVTPARRPLPHCG